MAELSPEDAAAAADQILPFISRAAPEPIERAELVDQSGLETDELRAGVAVLIEREAIVETDDGYALPAAAPVGVPPATPGAGEEEDAAPSAEGPETPDPASPASVPGAGQNYRATFDITATYAAANDEGALQSAAAMEEEIADLVHAKYPGAVIAVDVKRVEAYKPRVIFGEDIQAE